MNSKRIKKENEGLDRDGLRKRVKVVGEESLKKKNQREDYKARS